MDSMRSVSEDIRTNRRAGTCTGKRTGTLTPELLGENFVVRFFVEVVDRIRGNRLNTNAPDKLLA